MRILLRSNPRRFLICDHRRHGLSYTSFALSDLKVKSPTSSEEALAIEVSVDVKNTGPVVGSEVVQLYVSLPPNGTTTPKLQLRSFAKLRDIPPGKTRTATMKLDKLAVSFWDTPYETWKVVPGKYGIHVGTSSESLALQDSFVLGTGFEWTGL